MAKTELDAFGELMKLLKAASKEGVDAAQMAAAKVFLSAAKSAAQKNKKTGQLAESIAIVKSIDKLAMTSGVYGSTTRLLVGPTKKKGYYGFFLEHGHKAAGPHKIKRTATITTHSQAGVKTYKYVVARPWFDDAIKGVESAAMDAAQKAFDMKLQEIDSRA